MGFNLGAAITGGLTGFLAGGPPGAIIGAAGGGFAGGGGGRQAGVRFETVPQTPGARRARTRLEDIAFGEPPAVPRRGIAPLTEITPERELARETAQELAQPVDIFSLPEVQGIIQRAVEEGNLLTNRIARALQATGNITSTAGRDVLGRTVRDIQSNLAAALGPFAEAERGRRERLIPQLERLGLTEELRQMGFTQAELDALFQQQLTESQQLQTFTIPMLQSIISGQPAVQPIVSGQQPSSITEFAPLIGPLLRAVLKRDDSVTPGTGTDFTGYTLT